MGGLFEVEITGNTMTVEYEADSELSDFEQVPLEPVEWTRSSLVR